MGKGTKYVAKKPDANGYIHYTDDENAIWSELYARQEEILPGRACDEYLTALERLELPKDRVPQTREVSAVLSDYTGWEVAPVPALINFTDFFNLLADLPKSRQKLSSRCGLQAAILTMPSITSTR